MKEQKIKEIIKVKAVRDNRASTDDISVYRDVVFLSEQPNKNNWMAVVDGIDIPQENSKGKEAPLFFNHQDLAIPIGAIYNTRKEVQAGVPVLVGDFEINRTTQQGKEIDDAVQNGYLDSVSIGLSSQNYEFVDVTGQEGEIVDVLVRVLSATLDEVSIVADPADAGADMSIKAMKDEGIKKIIANKKDKDIKDLKKTIKKEIKEAKELIAKQEHDKAKREIARQAGSAVYKHIIENL